MKLNTLLIAIFTLLVSTAAVAAENFDIGKDGILLSVSSRAEASRVPDVANISAGVVTEDVDSEKALRKNAEEMEKLMAAIKKAGIADKDVQTSGINLSPRYQYHQNRKPEITGYQASNTVNIKVRDIDRLGKVLDAMAAEGANQIHGPSFEIGEPEPVYDEARRKALKQAQARAETYADALGMKVRRILSISENGSDGPPRPMMRMEMATAKADTTTPVAPGETTLAVNLDLMFELGK
ncbi:MULTISPECIES: SIMPL domain-containing protein [unclassified Microbulbifer]|uniref:SIMPL domain-containing protein n=1 Tax=unclassified Microbulbifer TaxID=2619833 RepID=UPI0027E5585D|nr:MULTISPECIES: SIMPL domain-containing protein [unclassified Microbulbifer]